MAMGGLRRGVGVKSARARDLLVPCSLCFIFLLFFTPYCVFLYHFIEKRRGYIFLACIEVQQLGGIAMGAEGQSAAIWVCRCGCSTWELCEDGSGRCANCNMPSPCAGKWYRIKPDAGDVDAAPYGMVRGNGSVSFARERLKRLSGSEDAAMLIVAMSDGSVSLWCAAETKKQRRWAFRRLKEARGMLKNGH